MLSIAIEVDPLIFLCVYFVYNTNYIFPTWCMELKTLFQEGSKEDIIK